MMIQRYQALLIGNSTFPADPAALSALEGPPNDVAAMRSALAHPEFGLFAADDIRIRTERSSHELAGEIEAFFRDAERDDLLLLYYSGHGRLDESGGLKLCASNTRTDRLVSTALASDQLNDMIDGSRAATIVVVLDCCHSGAFKGAIDIATPIVPPNGRGRYVMAACRAGGLAKDADGPGRLSAFTHHLVAGMTGQIRKTAEEGFVSLDDLYEYIRAELHITSFQTPIRKATSDGGIYIARSRQRRRPLAVYPSTVRVEDVEPHEQLPVETIRVRGLLPGDLWTATTTAPWIAITRREDHLELRLTAQAAKSRGNVEVINSDTEESAVVRVILRPAAGVTQPAGTGEPVSAATGDKQHDVAPADPHTWLLGDLVERVPEARQALLVGVEGIPLAASGPLSNDDLDRLAAGILGIRFGGQHLAGLSQSSVRSLIADFESGIVMVSTLEDARSLALYTAGSADLGLAMYEMFLTAERIAKEPAAQPRLLNGASFKGGGRSAPSDVFASILDGLQRQVHGLHACLIASVDGLPLAVNDGFAYDSDIAAAVSCSLFGGARGLSRVLNAGAVRQVVVETSLGYNVLTPVGKNAVLLQFLDESADLGLSSYEAALLDTRIGAVLEPGRRSDTA